MTTRLTIHEREAQRLLAEWRAAESLAIETQRDLGYGDLVIELDGETDRRYEVFCDYCSDHDLCDRCGYKNRVADWPFGRWCPEHTEPMWIDEEIEEHGFDLDAWCVAHDYTRGHSIHGSTVTPNRRTA